MGSTILLVDDPTPHRQQLALLLQQQGYAISAADTAEAALSYLQHHLPDLILLDNDTPGMDAGKLCSRIKTSPRTDNIPVIVMATDNSAEERCAAFSSGAIDFIQKPVVGQEVHARISTHLALRNMRRNIERWVGDRTQSLETLNTQLLDKINELEEAKKALKQRNALIHCLVDANTIGITFWRTDGTLLDANTAFLQILGLKLENILSGQVNLLQLVVPDERESTARHLTSLAHGRRYLPYEMHCLRSDGKIVPILIGSARLEGDEQMGVSFMLDLSEQRYMERELLESRQQLRDLAARGESDMEKERKRIAREVHDGLGSLLTAMKMDLSLLRMELKESSLSVRQRLGSIERSLEESVKVMRQVATALRPAVLNLGLLPSLEWLAERFRQLSAITCKVEACGEVALDDTRATALFRIVQESLTNIVRHAKASEVTIRMARSGNLINLAIADNGRGFDPSKVGSQSLGLLGMAERLEGLGGTLHIDSQPGRSTTLHIAIPIGETTT